MDKLANKIIDALGGTSAVAALCEIKPPSVCRWRHHGIPTARLTFFRGVIASAPLTVNRLCKLGVSRERAIFLKEHHPALFGVTKH